MTPAATKGLLLILLGWSDVTMHEAPGRVGGRTTGMGESEVVATLEDWTLEVVATLEDCVLEVAATSVVGSLVISGVGSSLEEVVEVVGSECNEDKDCSV